MVDSDYKKRVAKLIKKAKSKNLITKYSEFCDKEESKKYSLSNEDVIYYTSKVEGAK